MLLVGIKLQQTLFALSALLEDCAAVGQVTCVHGISSSVVMVGALFTGMFCCRVGNTFCLRNGKHCGIALVVLVCMHVSRPV